MIQHGGFNTIHYGAHKYQCMANDWKTRYSFQNSFRNFYNQLRKIFQLFESLRGIIILSVWLVQRWILENLMFMKNLESD